MSTSTAPTLATRLLGNREGTAAITQNVLLAIVGVAALWVVLFPQLAKAKHLRGRD